MGHMSVQGFIGVAVAPECRPRKRWRSAYDRPQSRQTVEVNIVSLHHRRGYKRLDSGRYRFSARDFNREDACHSRSWTPCFFDDRFLTTPGKPQW